MTISPLPGQPLSIYLFPCAVPCIFSTMFLFLDMNSFPIKSLQNNTATTKLPLLPSSDLACLSQKKAIGKYTIAPSGNGPSVV